MAAGAGAPRPRTRDETLLGAHAPTADNVAKLQILICELVHGAINLVLPYMLPLAFCQLEELFRAH